MNKNKKRAILSSSKNAPLPEGCRLGAVTFIQRFGKALNPHFHFHSCVIDGVFDKEGKFYPINDLVPEEIQSVQERIRKRILRLFRRHGLLESDAVSDMLDWDHGGFSLNANVRIEAHDRQALERLVRYCARPVFSGERLNKAGERLCYSLPKPTPDGQTILILKPSELLSKLAQLIPPPKRHRHHYHGVLAPHSPLRFKMADNANKELISKTAPSISNEVPFLAPNPPQEKRDTPIETSEKQLKGISPAEEKGDIDQKSKKEPSKASLYRWAMLMARIFEIFPLACPKCNHPMRIISFI